MNRLKLLLIGIIVVSLSGMIFYFNYENIISFFQNKEWEIADSFASTSIANFESSSSMLNSIVIVGTNYVKEYSNDGKEIMDLFVPFQEIVSSSAGDYFVIAEKNGSEVYLISDGQKLWETSVSGGINDIYVNKNGYVAIIYKQSGYKSIVKVLSTSGNELFTISLASTYAVDVAISSDNKKLAIAEIDTDGVFVKSHIKLIDINNLSNENVKTIWDKENTLIVAIEYTEKNELLIRTDSEMGILDKDTYTNIKSFSYDDTVFATIENAKNAIAIKKEVNGLFDTNYKLEICLENNKHIETKEYKLEGLPKQVKAGGNLILLVMDKEVLIFNTNGKLEKKIKINANVKDVGIFTNSNVVAIIFRDKVEFVKI